MEEKKETSLGERVAEKLRDENVKEGRVSWERIANIIDLEVKKNLGSETHTAVELPNAETGLAPCPFDGGKCDIEIVPMYPPSYSNHKLLFVGEIACNNRVLCGARMSMALNGRESLERHLNEQWNKRVPLISSRNLKSTSAGEKENSVAAPLIEALREAVEIIKIWHGDEAWEIYYDKAPEMKKIRATLAGQDTTTEEE